MFRNLLKNTDYILIITILALFVIGVFGIYSAGYGDIDGSNTEYQKQIVWFGVVCVISLILWAIDTSVFEFMGYALYGLNLVLLVLVLAMPSVFGASSWFKIGGISYQPSELMKIGYILCAAKVMTMYTENKQSPQPDKRKNIILLVVLGLLFIVPLILIILQPDFGTALVYVMITAFMIFKLGIKYRYIIVTFLIALILLPIIYNFLPEHAKTRIDVFLNPELDPLGDGYNAIQSKIAVGAGMFLGTGFLKGSQTQYDYLPVQSSDFIFSVISEEMGFVISALVVILYLAMLLRLLKTAAQARDMYTSFVTIGIVGMFAFHFIENIGMTIGLLPITGVPLPFVSYGGSNLLTSGIAIGIILNISARKNKDIMFG
ncbi:MAG: rod shape-determining protein RodA [Clostridia bacterium]